MADPPTNARYASEGTVMNTSITVVSVRVIREALHPDRVYFDTTLTPVVWPFDTIEPTAISVNVARGTAETWLRANGFTEFTVKEYK